MFWLAIGFTAIASSTISQAQQQNPAASNSGAYPKTDERLTQSGPVTVKLLNTGQSNAQTSEETAHVNYEERTERWVIGLTLAAVAVGILQLIAFINQAGHMKSTVVEMRRANDTTEKALLAGERPWVGVESVSVTPPIVGERLNVIVAVRNSGKSPALRHRGNIIGLIRAAAQDPPPIPADHLPNAGMAVLMPNGGVTFTPFIGGEVISQEQWDRIKDGRDIVWLMGRLTYLDGGGREHLTTISSRYHVMRNCFITQPDGNNAD